MIERTLCLECYSIDPTFTAHVCSTNTNNMLILHDINKDIYLFELPKCQPIECLDTVHVWYGHVIILDRRGCLTVSKELENIVNIGNIGMMTVVKVGQIVVELLYDRSVIEKQNNEIKLLICDKEDKNVTIVKRRLKYYHEGDENKQEEKFINYGSYSYGNNIGTLHSMFIIGKYIIQQSDHVQVCMIEEESMLKECEEMLVMIKERIFEIKIEKVVWKLEWCFMYVTKGEGYMFDLIMLRIVQLVEFCKMVNCEMDISCVVFEELLMVLNEGMFYIYELIKGTLLVKFTVESIILAVEGNINISNQKNSYNLLYDQSMRGSEMINLIDKENMVVYYLNVRKMIHNKCYDELGKVVVKELQGLEATHENIVKTLQFRGKMLSTFQSYIVQAMQSGSYGNCFRFFTNESNISVVNDCLQMLTAHLLVQFESNKKFLGAAELEKGLLQQCQKLIESKYEGHVETGLQITLELLETLKSKAPELHKPSLYEQIVLSKRITKILKQSKKKKLFELAYSLAVKLKGYEYVDSLGKEFSGKKDKESE